LLEEEEIIEFYRLYHRELFTYLYRFSGSPEEAEDIVQSCFEKLITYSAGHQIREDTVRAFLFRTAHNLCVNHLKRKFRRDTEFSGEIAAPAGRFDPQSKIEEKDLLDAVYRFLDGVGSMARSAFIMRKELEMSPAEIARQIGKSERTVRRILQATGEGLARFLKKEGFI
jgi:RNA polymerase sigma-70 factor (ECF subfamily)